MSIQSNQVKDTIEREDVFAAIPPYPVDMSSFLTMPQCLFDKTGVPYRVHPTGYHPTIITQYALAHWNQYLATQDVEHCRVFLAQAHWLVEHETHIDHETSGWPISFPRPNVHSQGSWLSALVQGSCISVLVRAYQFTREAAFLEVVHRAVRTFERDILDGGVNTPIGEDGIFFEDAAVYPAKHVLTSFIFALFGLYDYLALTNDAHIEQIICRSHATMHSLFGAFDTGFWTRSDLLHRHLATPAQLALQVELVQALATCASCEQCAAVTSRWESYRHRWQSRLRYRVTSRCVALARVLVDRIRTRFFPKTQPSEHMPVCIPLCAHPSAGGILTVLNGMAQVTADTWKIEYMAQYVLPDPEQRVIHRFGATKTTPWQFPLVWLYCIAGFWKLASLMRNGSGYRVFLPQDGLYTSAFASLVAKLTGARTVCIDHCTLMLLYSHAYRAECIRGTEARKWFRRYVHRILFVGYWPSLRLLARIAACFVDHYLVPGIAGDGLEEVCQRLGIDQSRVTRFTSMITIDQHVVLDAAEKARERERKSLPVDAIVIAIVCRLAPEKGLEVAIEAIQQAVSKLSSEEQTRVRVVIAGDGPLRQQLEEDIHSRNLEQICCLWGEISPQEVFALLAISDVFLYTSTRGAYFPMAILEAMASGCAVIASTQPSSNAQLLAEGRGIAVAPGDVEDTCGALVRLVNDLVLCHHMGHLAREYIRVYHSPERFKRTLMRATYWSALNELVATGKKSEIAS